MTVEIRQGDARDVLATLPAQSVHCVITSPSYYGLRDYGCAGQIGLEATPPEYVAALVEVFRRVWRVLRHDGTLWVVLGDSYNSGTQFNHHKNGLGHGVRYHESPDGQAWSGHRALLKGLKPKDLVMLPHRVALALQADGWYVRQELVWSKPAPMPESVTDRCTRSHEFIFMLAKQPHYYYDREAIREPQVDYGGPDEVRKRVGRKAYHDGNSDPAGGGFRGLGGFQRWQPVAAGRNKRSVWTIGPQPLADEHYAAFPEKLVEPMILAGTSEAGCCPRCLAPYAVGGRATMRTTGWEAGCSCDAGPPIPCTTLDPFLGSGTTALVSKRLGRSCVGIELNESYCEMARRRVESVPYTLFSGAASTEGAAR